MVQGARTAEAAVVVPAGISCEDLVAVVRIHADRVHDLVRRLGCEPAAAVEVVETSALELVDAVGTRPASVVDAVGWWCARARSLAGRVATTGELPLGGGLLSADDDQQLLAEALDQLPERDRIALLLRDAYDLPATTVGAALGTDADGAMARVAAARLDLLAYADGEEVVALPPHAGQPDVLARLAEGGTVQPRDATVRRHALTCDGCRGVTDALQRAHLLLGGLAVVALPAGDRDGVLGRVEAAAAQALPTRAELAAALAEEEEWEDDDPRLFSPLLVLLGLVLAVLAGGALGALLSRSPAPRVDPQSALEVLPRVTAAAPLQAPPAPAAPAPPPPQPATRVFVIPSPTPPPPQPVVTTAAPTPSAAPTTAPPAAASGRIALDPASGTLGSRTTVSGTGWRPGGQVVVQVLDATGQPTDAREVVTADATGGFVVRVQVGDRRSVPGRFTVRATDGRQTASASYDAR